MFLKCSGLVEAGKRVFAQTGRVHLPDALDSDAAKSLHDALKGSACWSLVMNSGEKVYDLAAESRVVGGENFERRITEVAAESGRAGFQFLFESIRLSEDGEPWNGPVPILKQLTEFLNSKPFLEFARQVTGDPSIALADAQATRYRAGHFLTQHDDRNDPKRRRAAYVLNLTPTWKADWGGLLNFIDEDGHVAEGYTPAWNALNLFRVPQLHHVSYVNPLAGADRLSITGWLRAR